MATVSGTVPALPSGTATVVVAAQIDKDLNVQGVPQEIDPAPVATATINSSAFSVPVYDSATLEEAESQGHGVANLEVIVTSGANETTVFVPAPVAASSGTLNNAQVALQSSHQIQTTSFPPFHQVPQTAQVAPDNGPTCNWVAVGSQIGHRGTRIGEVHVANAAGVSDRFEFKTQNDDTLTVGVDYSSTLPTTNIPWTVDGSITLTDSLGVDGGFTFGQGTVAYVGDTTLWQVYELEVEGHSCDQWMIQAEGSDADVYGNTAATPGTNPWGGCGNDTDAAVLAGNGDAGWAKDQSKAENYGFVATVDDFNAGGSAGFTTDIEHSYANSGSTRTYICGTKASPVPAQSPILYNTP